jgi:hypothetical protein
MSIREKIWNNDKCVKPLQNYPDCLDLITSLLILYKVWRCMCCFSNFSIATGSLLFLAQLLLPIPKPKVIRYPLVRRKATQLSQVILCFGLVIIWQEGGEKPLPRYRFPFDHLHSSISWSDHKAASAVARKKLEEEGESWFWIYWYDDSVHFKMGQFHVKWSRRKFIQSWVLCSRELLNGVSIHLRHGPSFFIPPWQHVSENSSI